MTCRNVLKRTLVCILFVSLSTCEKNEKRSVLGYRIAYSDLQKLKTNDPLDPFSDGEKMPKEILEEKGVDVSKLSVTYDNSRGYLIIETEASMHKRLHEVLGVAGKPFGSIPPGSVDGATEISGFDPLSK